MTAATAERPVAQRAAYSARPTVLVDGQPNALVMSMLRTCAVHEAEGGLSSLAMTLSNWGATAGGIGYLFDAGGPLALGSAVKLGFGETTSPRVLFEGEVHAIESSAAVGAPPEITFLAEDKLFAARLTRHSTVYSELTPAQVVERIAARLGLQADVGDLGGASSTWAQLNESDLAFLRRLLARHDADLQINGDTLQVRRIADRERGTLQLTLFSQLQQLRVVADLAEQATEVSVSGFDAAQGSAFRATSRGSAAGPGHGHTGAALLATLQERSEPLAPLACRNQAEAQTLADTAFDARARRFVRVHGSTEGNAALRVGTVVEIAGSGRRFDNRYAVIEATHRWDLQRGYQTDFVAQSAFLANP
jgi:uncharacterized protein